MPNETELVILSRLIRKALQLDPNFHGNVTVKFDIKGGNICGATNVSAIESIDLQRLR